jgi:phosphonate transport system substrate-binding protein
VQAEEKPMKKNLPFVALILLSSVAIALGGCGRRALGTEGNPIVMSFVPFGDTPEILASGEEIARSVSERTELAVVASPAADLAVVRDSLCAGKAQVGWLNSFYYVQAHETCGVEVGLVTERFGSTTYVGQIIVRADRGITSLPDLKGRVMCWVDASSPTGYVLPRILLQANGLNPDTDFARTIEAGSHNRVVSLVYNGDCDAGATYADARRSIEADAPDVLEAVVVLAITPDVPNDSIAFHKDLPAEMRDPIIDALLEIARTEEGLAALGLLYSVSGLQRGDDSLFDPFRSDLRQAGIEPRVLVP